MKKLLNSNKFNHKKKKYFHSNWGIIEFIGRNKLLKVS